MELGLFGLQLETVAYFDNQLRLELSDCLALRLQLEIGAVGRLESAGERPIQAVFAVYMMIFGTYALFLLT